MKREFGILAAVMAMCVVVPAEPERRPGGPGQGTPGKAGLPEDAWRRLDRDDSGQVSYEEFAANERLQRMPEPARRQIFARLDKNENGVIERKELSRRGPFHGPGGERRRPLWLGDMDKDRDGEISFEEFRGGRMVSRLPGPRQREMFERMDADGNGVLDKADRPRGFRGGMPKLADLDRDKSGGVSYEEFSAGKLAQRMPEGRRREMFERLDRNGDGQLGHGDLQRSHGAGHGPGPGRGGPAAGFGGLDGDADGVLSFAEFRKAPWLRELGEDEQEDRFEALDKDGDLKLTPREFGAGRRPERRPAEEKALPKRPDGGMPGRRNKQPRRAEHPGGDSA
jgi:Ca2+-binding EF-hand superfamily protein